MQQTRAKMRAALDEAGHPHPLLAETAREHTEPLPVTSAARTGDAERREGIRRLARTAVNPHIHEYVYKASSDTERLVRLADIKAAAESGIGDVVSELASRLEPTLLTAEQSTPVLDKGLGGQITAVIETELRDIDSDADPERTADAPFLAAQMVVMDHRSQAYGRRTELWLHMGTTTGALTPSEARTAVAEARAFFDKFEVLIALAEREATGDFEGDPEIAAADSDALDRRIRGAAEAHA